jgi:hypothetical protein
LQTTDIVACVTVGALPPESDPAGHVRGLWDP